MILTFSTEQSEQWDSIVKSFNNFDVYWLSGYIKAFEVHGDGMPMLFYYEDNQTRGINVVMKRDISMDSRFKDKIAENRYFDFSTPYGYGGWLIEGENTTALFSEYEKWCYDNSVVSEFIRFHPIIKNHKMARGYYDVVNLGKTVAMDLKSEEIIWSNITSKNRNMIRKAKKNGIKVYNGRYPEIYRQFRKIYDRTMDKDNADDYYYFGEEFYDSILNDLPHNAQVFYAVFEDKIIAASIMLSANGRMNYHLSGSVKEYGCMAPSNLLLYEAAIWGSANGYRTLYLGGGVGSGEDSLFKFKRAFYRKEELINTFCIGKKIFDNDKYNELLNLRADETKNPNYFPKYRG